MGLAVSIKTAENREKGGAMKALRVKRISMTMISPILFCFLCFLTLARSVDAQTKTVNDVTTVAIGINVPLTGSYADQGKDEQMAYELAIEKINSAGGVLGKKIVPVLRDTKTNAKVAKENAIELIEKHGIVMLTGGSSSAEAVAQSAVCQERGIIFMAALTHSDATTGFDTLASGFTVQTAHRNTFRWYFNAWMTGKALAPYLVQRMKKGSSYFYITSDYTWGHSLEKSTRWVTELAGSDTVGSVLTPLGKTDYSSELTQAQKAKPDVLVLVLFGNDVVQALKQAQAMGLKNKMKIVVPLMELGMAHGAGFDAMAGVLATKNWYWGLQDRFPGTKQFVDAFRSKYGKPPGSSAACAWVAIHEWAAAVKRANSFAANKIVPELEGHKFTLLKDEEQWRDWDHQVISSVFIVEGKPKGEAKDEWDLFKIIGEKKGIEVMQSREENPVTLEPLPKQ